MEMGKKGQMAVLRKSLFMAVVFFPQICNIAYLYRTGQLNILFVLFECWL